jgi:hypothetical protein
MRIVSVRLTDEQSDELENIRSKLSQSFPFSVSISDILRMGITLVRERYKEVIE